MDYDDNDSQDQSLHLAGEGSSKVSPILRSYALPKIDFDDSLPAHLRFDSLVENEVFLGITSQEDNQWIEEYSRGTSAIQFSSSVTESRIKNVWSEATSSESVEMLLKSVGQEEKVVEETIFEELDACDEPGSLTNFMDPNLKQCDGKDQFVGSKLISDCEQSHTKFTSQSQETQISGGELDSVVISDHSLSVLEKKVDKICGGVNQKEASALANESFNKELREDPSVSKVECGNASSSPNVDASIEDLTFRVNPQEAPERCIENASGFSNNVSSSEAECVIKSKEMDDITNSDTIVETSTPCMEKPSPVLNAEFLDKPSVEVSIPVDECNNAGTDSRSASAEMPAEDVSNKGVVTQDDTSKVHLGESNDEDQRLPAKLSGLVQVGDETLSAESGAILMNQDVTCNEIGDARLPLDSGDMNMEEVVGDLDSETNVELSSFAEVSEANTAVLTDAVPSGTVPIADVVTKDQPKPPILGVSLLPDDNEEEAEVGFSSEVSPQKGTPDVKSMVDSASDGPLSVVEKGAVSDRVGEVVRGMAGQHVLPVENCNASLSEHTANDDLLGLEGSKTSETGHLPCDSSKQEDNNAKLGQVDRKGSMTGQHREEPQNLAVNMSDEQKTSVDVAGASECDAKLIMQNGGGSVSMDEAQILSVSETNVTELSQIAKDTEKALKDSMINDKQGKVQSVSSNNASKEEKNFTYEANASAGIRDLSLAQNMKVSSVNSSGVLLDPNKLHEVSLVSPQTPSSAATQAGDKGNSERKPRRKSVGKEATSGRRSGRVEKSPTTGQESKPDQNVESSNPKPGGILPSPASMLPDLNGSTSTFQQSFNTNQQVQLRAQILVYGSLIAGMPPEEPHMIAAFGQSDGGKKAWEAAWHAYLERVHDHKSQAKNPDTPMQSRSGNKDPDLGIKMDSAQSKFLSPLSAGPSNMGTSSPFISPVMPISSPLWTISTPYDPGSSLLDYRQAISPLRVQSFAAHPSWVSQGLFSGQRVASSPVSTFTAPFPVSPITDSVKLTTIKESSAPGVSPVLVDHNAGPSIFPRPQSEAVSYGQPPSDSKSQKRKKVAASVAVGPTCVSSHAQAPSVSTPVVDLPRTEGYINRVLFLAQNQTDSGFPTPASVTPKSNPGSFPSAISLTSTHGDQNIEKFVTKEENFSKVEESKRQAEDAAIHAAAAISHCQDVWSQLERQKSSGLVSDDEAKLASSAVSVAAASSVAKVAASAAKLASNVAEQARLMAEEVFLSSRTENFDQSSKFDKALSNPIITAAREAARRRIEAASAAAKHAENLDAIVKAAELAAEAVSQAGRIVGMGNLLSLSDLVEAGPEGYWKNLEGTSNSKETETLKCDISPQEDSRNLAENEMVIDDENDKMIASAHKGPGLHKPVGVISETEPELVHTSVLDQKTPQSISGTSKENNIKEGCLVEVYKDDNKHKSAWLAAKVLCLKDGKVFVCYTEIQSDDDSGQLKEWIPLEVQRTRTPRIRIAHPVTTMRFEGTRKRHRTAVTDYSWSSGDHVDVWVQDCWREGVVVETNKIDVTSLTVEFPAQGETSVVRSWHVRPSLIWKDDKWIEWSCLKGPGSSKGDVPDKKRPKLGSPVVEGEKDKLLRNFNLVESGRHQESKILPVSAQESSLDLGKRSRDENKLNTRKTIKSGIQKEGSGVVFGVPKPGKKQKFMDVINVADGTMKVMKNNAPNDSAKLASYLMPRGPKNNSKNDAKEKQVVETKSKVVKTRKPPVPLFRTKSCKTRSRDALTEYGSSSNNGDSMDAPKEASTSKHVKKGKMETKVEVKEKSSLETGEPRRSNRKIQPTSRLLEGLQSSLTISKIHAVSHTSQRSHNKVTSKGNTNHGQRPLSDRT